VPAEDLKKNPFIHRAAADPDKERADQEKSFRQKQIEEEAARKKLEEQRRKIETALTQLTIQSILYSDQNPMVLIGNQVYRAGDPLGIFVISRINRNGVELKVGDETFVKTLD
jgi:hypothetical protein